MTNISRRTFIGGASAALSAATMWGCANQAASSGDKGSDLTSLTFCLDYTPNTNHTGVYVAQAKGYFSEEGLAVNIVQPAEDTAEAMIGTGQAELGVSYQDYIASSYVAGNTDIAAVAAVIQHNMSGIMSRKEDAITRPAAMEGHTYATWNLPIEQATIKQVVEKDGGDYSKIELVPYAVDDDVQGLTTKGAGGKYQFDTVWVYEGWAVQNAHVQNVDVNYFSFISIDEVFDYYTPVIAANLTYAKEHPDTVRAFLRATKKGYEFAIEHPDEAASLLCEQVRELDAALVSQSQSFLAEHYKAEAESWGLIDGKRWARFYEWLNENKLVESELDVNAGWTGEYLA